MTREELVELIPQKLYDADTSDIPDREEWEELDGEDARDYTRRAEVAMEALDKADIGLVDWEAKMPQTTKGGLYFQGYWQAQQDMAGWRPVRRLE